MLKSNVRARVRKSRTSRTSRRSYLCKIFPAVVITPIIATVVSPSIVCTLAALYPCEIIETAASTKDFATSVVLRTLVVCSIDHGTLVRPVMPAFRQSETQSRCSDISNVPGISKQILV